MAVEQTPVQIVGAVEQRTRVTVRASSGNTDAVFLVAEPNVKASEGFPLLPGEGYQLDDRGARVALYAVALYGTQVVAMLTESE